jgi:hypothetical protein
MTVPSRGVRDIRTLSGRVDQVALPYRAYMRISCLEMERFRREQEKASSTRRICILNGRIQEIEAEKDDLLRGLGERGAGRPSSQQRIIPPNAPRRSAGTNSFKLKY